MHTDIGGSPSLSVVRQWRRSIHVALLTQRYHEEKLLMLVALSAQTCAGGRSTMRSCQMLQLHTRPLQCLPLNSGHSRSAFLLPCVGALYSFTSFDLPKCPLRKQFPMILTVKILGRVRGSSQNGGANGVPFSPRKVANLFAEEEIGAEHGEGFATYRPRGPLHVDVDYLNDRMRERGLQRIRYAMKPDEAFGLIYSWDNVLKIHSCIIEDMQWLNALAFAAVQADTRALRMEAWNRLADEEGQIIGNDPEKQRHLLNMSVERVLEKVLNWGATGSDMKRLTQRLSVLYLEALARVRAPMEGVQEWLEALDNAGVPCAVASTLDRLTLLAALQRMGLLKYFQAVVSQEDGMESIAHRYLSAAVKLDRPPFKCVVFEDDPRGITAAHNCTMKAVALIGSHPAYELTQADLAVSSFSELSVINLRRLFANKGTEFMDLQLQPEEKKPRRRKLTNDTLF